MKRTSRLLRNRAALHRQSVARTAPRSAPDHPPVTTLADPLPAGANAGEGVTLQRTKAKWLVGDWRALAELPEALIAQHPERDRVALLVACAQLQLDSPERARASLRNALQWGCNPQLAARLLISGVHNTMGRIAALREDERQIDHHFAQALQLTGDPESHPAAFTRAVREMARLGLLPQAAGLLDDRSMRLEADAQRPVKLEAEVTMLRSEVEILQHELSLALQRRSIASAGGPVPAQGLFPEAAGELPLEQASVSQLGQDLWVLERTASKRGGFFVEFGATDGVLLSNSYLLETRFGWSGICAEPNPKYFARLQCNRRCTVSAACIGPRSGEEVDFVLAEEYGGFVRDMDNDMHASRRHAYSASPSNHLRLKTISLHDLLTALGAPHDIDYLSIDTEGSEYDILASFPFDRWNVRLITVEHNFSPAREQIRNLLEPLGYKRTEAQWDDWYEKC